MKITNLKHWILLLSFFSIVTIAYSFINPKKQLQETPPPIDELQQKGSLQKRNITFSTSFENNYYTNKMRDGYFYAEVRAGKYRNEYATESPLNISLVIDRSGSMIGDKMYNAINAAKYIIDQLNENDYVSIVIYDDKIDVLQEATHPFNKRAIKEKIDDINARGSTNLMGGAEVGYRQVKKNYNNRYINRVLLLSDGMANIGITHPREINRIIQNHNNNDGITISTFGLGIDYNEDLMTSIAETGMGNYYFINHSEDIASIFRKELNGLKEVVAQNVELSIELPQNLKIEKVDGANYDIVGRKLRINLRDIFSEETKGILVKYTIQGVQYKPLSIQSTLTYLDVEKEKQEYISLKSIMNYTDDERIFHKNYNEWVSTQVALNISNAKLEEAMREVDKRNYQKAKQLVRENDEYISSKEELVSKSAELQKVKATNNDYTSNINAAPMMNESELKTMQKTSKSETYQIRTKKN